MQCTRFFVQCRFSTGTVDMQDILSTTLCDTPLSRIPVSGEARSWEVSMKIGDKFFIP